MVLNFYYLVYGLCINLQKLNLIGIGINDYEVEERVACTGCAIASIYFSYLSLPLGENMGRIDTWGNFVLKFKQ